MPPEAVVHVIDDDDAMRDSLTFLLRSARMDVRSYDSATAFLDTLPGVAAGCVVTDVRMPNLSGIDLLRKLRERGIAIPVIVMTGHGDVPLAVEAMKIGAVDFFEKPFDDEAMLAAVRAALGDWDKSARAESERAELHERIATLTNRMTKMMAASLSELVRMALQAGLLNNPKA